MVSAGTAETSPAEEIQLAATATVIIMVFSMSAEFAHRDAHGRGHCLKALEDGENDDHRRDVHAQAPARFQADVEIRQRHQPAEDHAGQHGPDGEVFFLVAAIDGGEPLAVALFHGLEFCLGIFCHNDWENKLSGESNCPTKLSHYG